MSRHEVPRFRITAWPGASVPEPPVLAVEDVQRSGEWFGLRLGMSHVPMPREVYLREISDADVRDLDDLASLAALGIWRPLGSPLRDVGMTDDQLLAALRRFHVETRPTTPVPDYDWEAA